MKTKETIIVSACLLGVLCKWNQENNTSRKVIDCLRNCFIVPVCPEQLGGLPTPRQAAERKGNCVYTKEGQNITAQFEAGADEVLKLAKLYGIHKAILKQRSPSCGSGTIYDGTFSGHIISGNGITAEKLQQAGIEVLSEDDL